MLQIFYILQGHQQRTVTHILSDIQTQRCIFQSQHDFFNRLMIIMPACLAHLKPSMAVIHLCALCTLAFCSALHKDAPSPRSLSLLNDALQRKNALHHSDHSSQRQPRRTAPHHRFHQSQGGLMRVPYGKPHKLAYESAVRVDTAVRKTLSCSWCNG